MGKLILRNNGLETQLINGIAFTGLTPQNNTYYIGVDSESGLFSQLNPSGTTINIGSGSGGANTHDVTYSELVNSITGSTLEAGSFYLITDFQTCYDQPDFDYDTNPITTGNYKQGPVEPILVLATSINTISEVAYQPSYPNDTIKYDWTYNITEVTSGTSYGRISERIDEFNNRTDYDHRNILFKRYKLYTYRPGLPLNGSVELLNDGTVNGVNTTFTALTIGDIIAIPSTIPSFYEITNIIDNVTMIVSGDTITPISAGQSFFKGIEETNDILGYFSYKRTNVKNYDYVEYTTFGNALTNSYVVNNYIGNNSNLKNIYNNTFLLSNNVFLEGEYDNNSLGENCVNNTLGTDCTSNTFGDYCSNNVSTNDIDNCIFGNSFQNNIINTNLTNNRIGDDFNNNGLLGENSTGLRNCIIGNNFQYNLIYSSFEYNNIGNFFTNNIIGDFSNLSTFNFSNNIIEDNFEYNTIRQDFRRNKVGYNSYSNLINGDFSSNTLAQYFNNNNIGHGFNNNVIGNYFYNNRINDYFYNNNILTEFNNNILTTSFNYNKIGDYFYSNKYTNYLNVGWGDLTNVTSRVYNTFRNALDYSIGNVILGKELVMKITSTSQYFKIKFNQWSQYNGGGFQYERQEIDSSGNNIGPNIIFTKNNNVNDVDIIVPGVLEITRGDNGDGIYNLVTEVSWNGSVSPADTEWNSIYTEPNTGRYFSNNRIGDYFQTNVVGDFFGNDGRPTEGNIIGNNFVSNTIGNYFGGNDIKNNFMGNTIGNNFQFNEIGNYFGNRGFGPGSPLQNVIFDDFKYNKIGDFFGNDTNYPSVGSGSNGDGGNIINDSFQFNNIGDNVIFNAFDFNFSNNKTGNNLWFNVFGINTTDNVIGNLFISNSGLGGFPTSIGDNFISNNIGNYMAFNEISTTFVNNNIGNYFGNAGVGTQNTIDSDFIGNNIGDYFGNDGTNISGGNSVGPTFNSNIVKSPYLSGYDFSLSTHVYGNYTCEIFTNSIGNHRLSYYDGSDVLNITNVND